MPQTARLIPEPAPAPQPLLRFIACGSVDDGKSTLLGRLLHDAHAVADDQNDTLTADSRRFGTTGDEPDFALLLDGLEAEREQGITIDVAYRYFATPRRKFIVADTPGHEQYTRNMVTGASTADLAIILLDASQGITAQTRRHSGIVHALGIRQIVLAINKMDLAGFSRARFETLATEYAALAERIGIAGHIAIPIAAPSGCNVVHRSPHMAWHTGPTLLEALESAPAALPAAQIFAMPVQRVARPNAAFRGYAGRIAAGSLRPGDQVRVLPSGAAATIARIVAPGPDRPTAATGESVMLTFAEQVDCARGDVLAAPGSTVRASDSLEASVIWFDPTPLAPARRYLLKLGTRTVGARVTAIASRFDPTSGHRHPAETISLNDIADCRLVLERPIALDTYANSRTLGGFILIDPVSNATVAAGLVRTVATPRATTARTAGLYRLTQPGDAAVASATALIGAPAVALTAPALEALHAAESQAQLRDTLAALLRESGIAVILADGDPNAPGQPLAPEDLTGPPDTWVI